MDKMVLNKNGKNGPHLGVDFDTKDKYYMYTVWRYPFIKGCTLYMLLMF